MSSQVRSMRTPTRDVLGKGTELSQPSSVGRSVTIRYTVIHHHPSSILIHFPSEQAFQKLAITRPTSWIFLVAAANPFRCRKSTGSRIMSSKNVLDTYRAYEREGGGLGQWSVPKLDRGAQFPVRPPQPICLSQ